MSTLVSSMVGMESTGSTSSSSPLTANPDYQMVRFLLLSKLETCLRNEFVLNYELSRGRASCKPGGRKSRVEAAFTNSVLELHAWLAPKVQYTHPTQYMALAALDGFHANPQLLSAVEAKAHLALMRNLLEDLRITKVESRDPTAAFDAVKGVTVT